MNTEPHLTVDGEFVDSDREATFRAERFAETAHHAVQVMAAAALVNVLFLASDARFFGQAHFYAAIPARLVIVFASCLSLLLIRRTTSFAGMERVLIGWALAVAAAAAVLTSVRTETAVLILFVVPAIYYLALPMSCRWTVICGLVCSATMLAGHLFSGPLPDTALGLALGVAALNMALVLVIRHAHRLRRLEWSATCAERRAKEELARNRAMLERIFAAVPIPLVVVSRDEGRLIKANDAARAFFGRPGSAGPLPTAPQLYYDPGDRGRFLAALERHGRVEDFETPVRIADGSLRHVLMAGTAIDLDGTPCVITGVVDITSRKAMEAHLERLATTDPLTGLANRSRFYALARAEIQRARRYARPLAVAMMDVDHFKRVNDTHGHEVGDLVLRGLADLCRRVLRQQDVAARMGGEEFAVLLPETTVEQGHALADRLRSEVSRLRVDQGRITAQITISIGMAEVVPDEDEPDAALARADQALYAAKRAGRNRVIDFPFIEACA